MTSRQVRASLVSALAAATVATAAAQTKIPLSHLGVTLSIEQNTRTRTDYAWEDATLNDCTMEIRWSIGSHIAGRPLPASRTPYAVTLVLKDLGDPEVTQQEDPQIAFTEYVTIRVAVRDERPPLRVERGADGSLGAEMLQDYTFVALAEPGRAFAEKLRAEIKRCSE